MTDARLTPTHATEQLDHRGLLAAARGPGIKFILFYTA
jgi:hypothetical protein